jgi:hypothetical protein
MSTMMGSAEVASNNLGLANTTRAQSKAAKWAIAEMARPMRMMRICKLKIREIGG